MARHSSSGQKAKVAQARRVVQQAFGEDPQAGVPTDAKYVRAVRVAEPVRVTEDTQYVLTLGEVAVRFGIREDRARPPARIAL